MNYAIVQDRFNSWLKSDSTDFDYKGSDPEPTYMKDIIETEYGQMTISEYQQRCKDERCKNS